ncbi:hypothetical protein GLO73106DRAFT_00002910 [Gloeocapsa sp. PCC 73106]|nr:hypothetical protein GLO73106DRAFT_00002910 [Gloeocapsa sp. PCC 73106]
MIVNTSIYLRLDYLFLEEFLLTEVEYILLNKRSCCMQLEEYFNVLAPDDIRLKGTRIGIESILYEYIYRARTAEEIAKIYPSLSLEQVYATILYYLHDREAVGQYLTDWIEFGERMRAEQRENPSPARLRFKQLKAHQTSKVCPA